VSVSKYNCLRVSIKKQSGNKLRLRAESDIYTNEFSNTLGDRG